ncbi:MAG: hypothetical protein SFZ03_12100 [Candidatus Melainabacteria bacterium]|nr:hypothetical protein [Candidatus Melainabacteria bacterium]
MERFKKPINALVQSAAAWACARPHRWSPAVLTAVVKPWPCRLPHHRQRKQTARPGLTLIEAAIAIGIIGIIGVAVSNVLLAGVEAQLSSKIHTHMETTALNIVDQLRFDLRFARNVTAPSPTTLQFTTQDNVAVTYSFTGGALTRNGTSFTANVPVTLSVTCGGCFQTNGKQVSLSGLQITDVATGQSNIDRAFGKASFIYPDATFDVLTATTFE